MIRGAYLPTFIYLTTNQTHIQNYGHMTPLNLPQCTVVLSVLVNRSAAGVSIPTELLYEDDYDYLCL